LLGDDDDDDDDSYYGSAQHQDKPATTYCWGNPLSFPACLEQLCTDDPTQLKFQTALQIETRTEKDIVSVTLTYRVDIAGLKVHGLLVAVVWLETEKFVHQFQPLFCRIKF